MSTIKELLLELEEAGLPENTFFNPYSLEELTYEEAKHQESAARAGEEALDFWGR